MTTDPGTLVTALLDLRTWQAFDVDESGRVLAGHDELGTVQLVEIAPDGSRTALTALPGKCSGRYLPGRRQVVVQHDNGGDENMQLSLLDLATPPAEPVGPEGLTALVRDPAYMHVLQDVTRDSVIYSTNRRNGVDMDVVVRALDTGAERTVYDRGGYVVDTAVSHDETSVAVTGLSLRPASTVVALAGPRAVGQGRVTDPDEHAMHRDVAWSADDGALLMSSNHEREFAAVVRVSPDGTAWSWVVEDDEHDLTVWVSPDGTAMVVGTVVDGVVELAVHEADGAHRCGVGMAGAGLPDVVWAADGTRFAVTLSTPTDPGSIHLVEASDGRARTVADARAGVDPELLRALVAPAVHRVPTPDGEQVPCFVYPPGAHGDPALEGASVLLVHGGPEACSWRQFTPMVQALSSVGLTVLVPNVRGSTGYGKRWYSLDDVDKRLHSVADLAALHAWLPRLGLDPGRSALWGGSYGGYMVLAGVSMQPGLWAAGVDIVGMSSLVTFLENTSAYRVAYREREYGSLERDRELLQQASPITYLDDIVAPLFVIHGANDPRVPLSEAEQIKAALDGKGVECELRVYHDEGHGLAKRANRQDAYPAAVEFLRRHLARVSEHDRLLQLIRDKAVVHGRVTLSSGKEADYYVDLRRITLDGEAAPLVGRVMTDLVADLDIQAVGGLTMGADPVATAMLHAAASTGRRLDAFVVRKAEKTHGLQQRIEGPSIEGRRVLVVEDTSTTGGSPLTAVQACREAGAEVVAVAVIADRASGAREKVEAEGIPYRAAYGLAELGLR